MKQFEDAAAALQVGVRRSPYQKSEYLEGWQSESAEKAALVDAGVLGLMRRAGVTSSTTVSAVSEAPEEISAIAEKASAPLVEAIDLGLDDLIVLWARTAKERGRVAPPGALVKLLSLAAKYPEALTPILGARGRWLAELMGVELTGTTPAIEQEDLAAQWPEMDWKQRAGAIEHLDLSVSHEPFLVEALVDRRKEVRELAAKKLAQLPKSAFAQAVSGSVRTRIRVERKLLGRQLIVDPPSPENLPKTLPRTPKNDQLGEKAHALVDALSFIPPSFWERETGQAAPDLISLAMKTDYRAAVIEGWHQAAVAFEDQGWIDALFMHFLSQAATNEIRRLAPLASGDVFESAYRSRLNSNLILPPRQSSFSAAFSRLVVEAAKSGNLVMVKETATALHLSALPLLQAPWDSPADKMRATWYRYLDLKKRLFESLEP